MLRDMASHNVNEYEKDGAEIYRRSFAAIRACAELGGFSPEQSQIAVRMIHACGMPDLARDIEFSPEAVRQIPARRRERELGVLHSELVHRHPGGSEMPGQGPATDVLRPS